VTELAEGMQEETGQGVLADDVAVVLAARLGTLITKWDDEVDAKFEAKSRVLNRLCRSVVQLQHGMHRARRESFEYARQWEEQEKAEMEEMRQKIVQPSFPFLPSPDRQRPRPSLPPPPPFLILTCPP
jgi:hypothetical protein